MTKDIKKSLRLSADVVEIIDAMPGDTFSDRFAALVYQFAREKEAREFELQQIQERIDRAKENLKALDDAAKLLMNYNSTIRNAQATLDILRRQTDALLKDLKEV